MELKTKIMMENGLNIYSEIHRDLIVSRMRTGNNGGSCVMKAYLDEGLTQEVFINVNLILYVQSV